VAQEGLKGKTSPAPKVLMNFFLSWWKGFCILEKCGAFVVGCRV